MLSLLYWQEALDKNIAMMLNYRGADNTIYGIDTLHQNVERIAC